MKKLNLLYFVIGLLIALRGISKLMSFDKASLIGKSEAYQIGNYTGMTIIPIIGVSLIILAIRRFKFVNEQPPHTGLN